MVAQSPEAMHVIFGTPLKWVVMLAPLGFVFLFAARIHTMTAATAQMVFWAFAAVMGLSMASIFMVFTGTSIARVFFITASAVGATSLSASPPNPALTTFGSSTF